MHWIGLDHIRALAALLVFSWHFMHGHDGAPISFDGAHILSIVDEGHTGVALFMTLSGYLFAKLLDGKTVAYLPFFWTRFLRLAPLMLVVVIAEALRLYWIGADLRGYAVNIAKSPLTGALPNGGWSIIVEAHFYFLLPALLFVLHRDRRYFLAVLLTFVSLRLAIYAVGYDIHRYAYGTIIGRMDQFVLGLAAFFYRDLIRGRHIAAVTVGAAFLAFYYAFDAAGGVSSGPAWVWVILPTVEGVAYAFLIAWYDQSFRHSHGPVSRFIAKMGDYSYSIYLLHYFVVFYVSAFIARHVMDLSNFYVAFVWSILMYLAMMPIGYLSMRFIENPPRRFRKRYVR
ncbi:peptidoglycan/LPS O-acetylase OafA/YrhL [Sphingomonas sp. PP-CE-3A-406]|uniref:acyltransferase family protein n=1 Tax=Sphingomonas sp. PP-CE-3A-406 TaxID=2135659 RepID=UPI000EFA08B0|nr:acyltransferase [Sphingomonas sp. PP-CE-3A-406]RMB51744.1 peptidoglycan/LPS O-acetylase OafA/YrhL [Sphingomonas sp. PP-CE-3A-406]